MIDGLIRRSFSFGNREHFFRQVLNEILPGLIAKERMRKLIQELGIRYCPAGSDPFGDNLTRWHLAGGVENSIIAIEQFIGGYLAYLAGGYHSAWALSGLAYDLVDGRERYQTGLTFVSFHVAEYLLNSLADVPYGSWLEGEHGFEVGARVLDLASKSSKLQKRAFDLLQAHYGGAELILSSRSA
jgi:hypothetical protein